MNGRTSIEARNVFEDKQHNRLLRLFSIACISSAILILSLFGLSIYAIFSHFILNEAENDAVRFGRGLLEHEIEPLIRSEPEKGSYIKIDEVEFPFFDQRVQRSIEFFQVSKVKIYSTDERIVYSTDHAIIGETDRGNKGLTGALNGKIVSELQSGSTVWDLENEQRFELDMVETYIPVRDQNNMVVGVFEIYMAVSSYREGIKKVLTFSLLTFFVILACVFGTLLYFMKRATKTIYSKTRELRILSGLLPICSFCKKIRNTSGEWEHMERYITKRSESKFSHSLCPVCKEKHYPKL